MRGGRHSSTEAFLQPAKFSERNANVCQIDQSDERNASESFGSARTAANLRGQDRRPAGYQQDRWESLPRSTGAVTPRAVSCGECCAHDEAHLRETCSGG